MEDPSYLLPWIPHIQDFVRRANSLPLEGLTVTSWWRGPGHNRSVGGSTESQHLFALGVDIAGDRRRLQAVAERAPLFDLVAVLEPGHLHIQRYPAGALRRAGVTFPT